MTTASWDTTARTWDAATGECLLVLGEHAEPVSSAAFSADRTRVATASWDTTAGIWNAVTGECLRVLKGHGGQVTHAAFSPDGERVVTASHDKTARIWKRRRPEWWWGIFWLIEFWFTVVFAGLLVWSVWRDRKTFRGKAL